MTKLTRKERVFLTILSEPGATIATGTAAGKRLHALRYVSEVKWGRYGITPAGAAALAADVPGRRYPRARRTDVREFL
jgi:hypothetical protein